jgi:hypothetical protein
MVAAITKPKRPTTSAPASIPAIDVICQEPAAVQVVQLELVGPDRSSDNSTTPADEEANVLNDATNFEAMGRVPGTPLT